MFIWFKIWVNGKFQSKSFWPAANLLQFLATQVASILDLKFKLIAQLPWQYSKEIIHSFAAVATFHFRNNPFGKILESVAIAARIQQCTVPSARIQCITADPQLSCCCIVVHFHLPDRRQTTILDFPFPILVCFFLFHPTVSVLKFESKKAGVIWGFLGRFVNQPPYPPIFGKVFPKKKGFIFEGLPFMEPAKRT